MTAWLCPPGFEILTEHSMVRDISAAKVEDLMRPIFQFGVRRLLSIALTQQELLGIGSARHFGQRTLCIGRQGRLG
ncbi:MULTISPECIES: hypothetical protein [Comamonas]|uniref:hypothetical protein n=1 Tax=Comamonas TaxID=283 RepID=UPI0012C285E8|nr:MULTISPECIES: hypothetical protein [Comamonas]MEB5966800.1 hypothetical protein [Comamonas testosteroni]MPS96656.1 hypothetical protein [Comamonas sp.]